MFVLRQTASGLRHATALLAVGVCLIPAETGRAQSLVLGAEGTERVAKYNVVWDSPSRDYSGSMPIGNGDISLNVWVEDSGDVLFYIGKSDSWDDNGRLLKVGRIRLSLKPSSPSPLRAFRQTLLLESGTVAVHYGDSESAVDIRLWVDANYPVIHLEVETGQPTSAVAAIELWRTTRTVLPSIEVSDVMFDGGKEDRQHGPTTVEPDSVLPHLTGRIGWYHRNVKSVGPELCAELQGLTGFKRPDPLLHRIFGGIVTAERPEYVDNIHLGSSPSKRHAFSLWVLTKIPATPHEWLTAIDSVMARAIAKPHSVQRKEHEHWWRDFWNRSWVTVTARAGSDTAQVRDAFEVSRAYALQRFVSACAGRGQYPIKFNGSIFTVPYPGKPGDADYRQWGPGYWWQNTRLPYYSMCASGDFDLMQPLFRMYGSELMPLFRYRTRLYLNHDGAFLPECIYFWGDIFNETYGWTPFELRGDKLQESRWHKWEWVSGLELVFLMLDYYDHTLDERFLREMTLPTAHEVLTFFDQQYRIDSTGTMAFHPSQACETWWECTNPMPEIAGLHAVTDRLLSLPENATTVQEREFWIRLKQKLPQFPTRVVKNTSMLAPAGIFDKKMNVENPELYAVFPFRLVTSSTMNKNLGVEAFTHRLDRGNAGWRQDDIFAAYLGLSDTARTCLTGRAKSTHSGSRFPAFWGPNYDWIPDQDHGSVLLKTLQAMILQTDGKTIHLLPAWPAAWDVDFKLHAPYSTVVQGMSVNGVLKDIRVKPEARRQDILNTTHR